MNWTDAQQKALRPGGKLVLAGAGSGKTTVLTERYVRLLGPRGEGEPVLEPRQIVATTFSKKAAANLAAKVHEALLKRQQEAPGALAEHWALQREKLPWARIGTLHSFCGQLLRAWPVEAGVDPDFVVGMEREQQRRERVDALLRRRAKAVDPAMGQLLLSLGKQDKLRQLLLYLLNEPEIGEQVLRAAHEPNRAARGLDELANLAIDRYRLEGEDRRESLEEHRKLAELMSPLAQLFEPLLAAEQGVTRQLSYDELERYALRLLRRGGRPARAIRASIRELMVDEFQDTSTRQWELIQELVRDEASGRVEAERLFLVGDEKQSIYRFRKADVTVVHRARETMAKRMEELAVPRQSWEIPLADNYRSRSQVLEPLNALFDRLLAPTAEQHLPFEATPQALAAKRRSEGETAVHFVVGRTRHAEHWYGWLAAQILGWVKGEAPWQVFEKQGEVERARPAQFEDIGILLRTRSKLPELERALRRADIPYTVAGGRGFLAQQEVLDLTNLIATLADPRDELALLGVLRSPLFNLSDTAVAGLFRGSDPWRALREMGSGSGGEGVEDEIDRKAIQRAATGLAELRREAEQITPTELLLRALEEGGAWSAYAAGPRGDQRVANIYQLIERVRQLVAEGHYSLRRLNEALLQLREERSPEDDAEAAVHGGRGVKIMTIHASKGLEFPIVVLPDLSTDAMKKQHEDKAGALLLADQEWSGLASPHFEPLVRAKGSPQIYNLLKDRAMRREAEAELMRLHYVAATRARDHLWAGGHLLASPAKGVDFKLMESSGVAVWLRGLGLDFEPNGEQQPPRQLAGLHFQVVEGEELARTQMGLGGGREIEPLAQEDKLTTAGAAKLVQIAPPPPADRWSLPITAFAAYLADPDEALYQLLYYERDPWLEQQQGEDRADTEQPQAGGSLIGTLVHRAYQRFGPGCGWTACGDWLEFELAASGEATPEQRARLRELIDAGEAMGLARYAEGGMRELPLLISLGPLLLRGRIDLALRRPGEGPLAIDYKTNRIDRGGPAELAEQLGYPHQARLYALGLLGAWGGLQAEGRLVFLDRGQELSFRESPEGVSFYREAAQDLLRRWAERTARKLPQ